jgi:hypothetical protein
MDSKISDFPVATGTSVADLIPIISGGLNKTVTVGIFSLNLPNLGNKGISKNIVTPVSSGTVIPLTNTIITLPTTLTAYTLAAGTEGQEITLVSLAASISVTSSSANFSMATFANGSSLTLIFVTGRWFTKSSYNCTLT